MLFFQMLLRREAAAVNSNLQVKKLREELAQSSSQCQELEKVWFGLTFILLYIHPSQSQNQEVVNYTERH